MGRTTTFNEAFEAMNVRVADFFRNLMDQAEKTASRRLLGSLAMASLSKSAAMNSILAAKRSGRLSNRAGIEALG